jgi:hypothetical protein
MNKPTMEGQWAVEVHSLEPEKMKEQQAVINVKVSLDQLKDAMETCITVLQDRAEVDSTYCPAFITFNLLLRRKKESLS